jgi:hypothetical protein
MATSGNGLRNTIALASFFVPAAKDVDPFDARRW